MNKILLYLRTKQKFQKCHNGYTFLEFYPFITVKDRLIIHLFYFTIFDIALPLIIVYSLLKLLKKEADFSISFLSIMIINTSIQIK